MTSQIKRIRQIPVVIDKRHESRHRAHHVLQYVRSLLELGTPTSVVLEIIAVCYENDLEELRETTWEEMRADKP